MYFSTAAYGLELHNYVPGGKCMLLKRKWITEIFDHRGAALILTLFHMLIFQHFPPSIQSFDDLIALILSNVAQSL